MSFETDLVKFKKQVDSFSIAGASGNFHTGFSLGDDTRGAGAGVNSANPNTPEDVLSQLESSFKNFTIRGGHDVSVSGSLEAGGFAISAKPVPSGEGVGGGSGTVLGCTDPLANNFNPDATEDDGSCTYDAVCPELNMVCDTTTKSLNKCGFAPFGFGPCYNASITDPGSSCSLCGDVGSIGDGQIVDPGSECNCNIFFLSKTITMSACDDMVNAYQTCLQCNYSAVGSNIVDITGSGTITQTDTYNTITCEVSSISEGTISFDTCYPGTFCANPFTGCNDCDPPGSCVTGSVDYTNIADISGCVILNGVVMSDEYTTATLISSTESALPSYLETFDGVCLSSRELNEVETSYAIQRFKYKWTFSATPVAFTISWNEHTEFDDLTTSDNPLSTSVGIGDTETTLFECFEPSANGITTITDVVCTLD